MIFPLGGKGPQFDSGNSPTVYVFFFSNQKFIRFIYDSIVISLIVMQIYNLLLLFAIMKYFDSKMKNEYQDIRLYHLIINCTGNAKFEKNGVWMGSSGVKQATADRWVIGADPVRSYTILLSSSKNHKSLFFV